MNQFSVIKLCCHTVHLFFFSSSVCNELTVVECTKPHSYATQCSPVLDQLHHDYFFISSFLRVKICFVCCSTLNDISVLPRLDTVVYGSELVVHKIILIFILQQNFVSAPCGKPESIM